MKMQLSAKANSPIAFFAALTSSLLMSCGVTTKSHYKKDKKKYGQLTQPGDIQGINIDESNTLDEVAASELKPGDIVYRPFLVGLADTASLRIIKTDSDGNGQIVDPSTLWGVGAILGTLTSTLSKPAQLTLEQTMGERALNVSAFRQTLESPTDRGMLATVLAKPAESRTQEFLRRVGIGECPNTFVCVEKQKYESIDGLIKTFCYYDAATEKLTTIPYTPSPKAKQLDFEQAYRIYPDYVALSYDVEDVECPASIASAKVEPALGFTATKFRIVISKIPDDQLPADTERKIQSIGALPIEYGIRVSTEKVDGDANLRPYIDESLVLQSDSKYYLSESEQVLVKFIKTVRKPLKGSGTAIGDAIMVDYHFEFCQDQTSEKNPGPNFCEKK